MSEIQKFETELNEAVETAKNIVVTTNSEEKFAVEFLQIIKTFKEMIGEEFDKNVDDAHRLYKNIFAQRKKYKDPLEEAEDIVKDQIKEFRLDQEKKRLAKEKAEKDLADRLLKEEQDRLLKQAEAANNVGDTKKADELAVKAVTMENGYTFVPRTTVKQQGMSTPMVYKFKVLDQLLVPREYLIVDEKKLGELSRSTKGEAKVPGVEFYGEPSIRIR